MLYKEHDPEISRCVAEMLKIIQCTPMSRRITFAAVYKFASVPITCDFTCARKMALQCHPSSDGFMDTVQSFSDQWNG
jgi:hypothetical protein